MGERKVLNRYIPPDMDVTIMPKGFMKRPKDKLVEVRMMLPFSLRCNTCGEYMYKGKKFNSKSEIITDDNYMGIRKFRFYIKCCVCSAEITFKTDPKNADYECEFGASRNFEMWRDNKEALDGAAAERAAEDNLDSMKALENKTLDNKVEMDVLDALDEMRAINRRHEKVDTESMLSKVRTDVKGVVLNANGLTEADEEFIKSIKFKPRTQNSEEMTNSSTSSSSSSNQGSGVSAPPAVKKQQTQPTVILKKKRKLPASGQDSSSSNGNSSSSTSKDAKQGLMIASSTTSSASSSAVSAGAASSSADKPTGAAIGGASLGGLLMGYGSDDSD